MEQPNLSYIVYKGHHTKWTSYENHSGEYSQDDNVLQLLDVSSWMSRRCPTLWLQAPL